MLREFHNKMEAHGRLAPDKPTADIPKEVQHFRMDLLMEEVLEYVRGVGRGDIVEIADGLADLVYVAVGTAVVYGIPFDKVFAEIHRSNMTKTNNPDLAKLVKGPDYEPPRIREILESN